jgi:hypothetical protein
MYVCIDKRCCQKYLLNIFIFCFNADSAVCSAKQLTVVGSGPITSVRLDNVVGGNELLRSLPPHSNTTLIT